MLAGAVNINAASEAPTDRKTLALDIAGGATGFLMACHVAGQALASDKFSTAMIVASEIEYNRDVWPERILGLHESSSAAVLDCHGEGDAGFERFHFRRFPQHGHRFQSRSSQCGDKAALSFRRDRRLHEYYLDCVSESVAELLEENHYRMSDIDLVLPPQISPNFVDRLQQRMQIPAAKLVRLAASHGDLYTSSLAHSIAAARRDHLIRPGKLGLIIEVGAGMQTACAIYRW